jgi:hypothetical protein
MISKCEFHFCLWKRKREDDQSKAVIDVKSFEECCRKNQSSKVCR